MKENVTALKKSSEEAERSNEAKSLFIANMSHEIRTPPLNGLVGFLDLLAQSPLNLEQRKYMDTIKFSADSLMRVLNDILDVSKIESGMLTFEETEVDLAGNIISALKSFYANAHESGINIFTYIAADIPPTVFGDPMRITQILCNLISNAVKFTPKNGVVKVIAQSVEETAKTVSVKIEVVDTGGIGIPEDKLKNIFESFGQVDSSVTRKYGGTGLGGLTICKNLLAGMGGSNLIVESEEGGVGSNFYFVLKLKKNLKNI